MGRLISKACAPTYGAVFGSDEDKPVRELIEHMAKHTGSHAPEFDPSAVLEARALLGLQIQGGAGWQGCPWNHKTHLNIA